ncbi:MAG: hypothetical protein COZ75_13310 [Flavobacteriaceae bacterium CG_4_8_14_3_um_filter_34_10]|nr:MAG: hypothetical protein COZ75_13310 [Flavobacteriaceae bacterium CG_4_8_14_3_um_filter_34_10]
MNGSHEKKIHITAYREEYERNIERVNSPNGRYMKGKRQSTVEPVFGTLKEFMGLRKVNTIGIKQANKCMHLAAIAYNLKKYIKATIYQTRSAIKAQTVPVTDTLIFSPKTTILSHFKTRKTILKKDTFCMC